MSNTKTKYCMKSCFPEKFTHKEAEALVDGLIKASEKHPAAKVVLNAFEVMAKEHQENKSV